MVLIVKMEDEELTQCASRRMRLGTSDKGYNPADDAKNVWVSENYAPIDDVKEVLNDGNLFEHKLHLPINVLLKQMVEFNNSK